MNTKTIATILVVVGLAALIFLNTNPMSNNRYQSANTSSTQSQSDLPESRLKDASRENLPVSSENLTELKSEVIQDGNTDEDRTVQTGDSITVNYTGWLASDGTIFDSSFNEGRSPFKFTVGGGVIEGWSQGVVGMKIGEIRRLMIPSELGYGDSDQGVIPPNSDLIFDVELLGFNN